MRKPIRQRSDNEDDANWLTTYADAITLLMAFFVLLLQVSSRDVGKYEEMAEAMEKSLEPVNSIAPKKAGAGLLKEQLFKEMVEDMKVLDAEYKLPRAMVTTYQNNGFKIEFASESFYKSGSAEFGRAAIPILNGLLHVLTTLSGENYLIHVEGHTDDEPIATVRYPSNWELSAARATAIVRYFINAGIPASKLKAKGFADTRPKVANRDKKGKAIRRNQDLNRRIEIHISRVME